MSKPKHNPKDRFLATLDDFGESVMTPTEEEIEKVRAESAAVKRPTQPTKPPADK